MSRLALLADDDGALEQENCSAVENNLPIKFWDELGVVVPPDGLVRRLLGTKSLALIYGDPGSGKTFLATDLSLHIAVGWNWFGRKVAPGAVLYVACEGEAGFNNRVAGARDRYALPTEVPFALVPAAVNLGPGGEDARRVVAAAKATEARTGQRVCVRVCLSRSPFLSGFVRHPVRQCPAHDESEVMRRGWHFIAADWHGFHLALSIENKRSTARQAFNAIWVRPNLAPSCRPVRGHRRRRDRAPRATARRQTSSRQRAFLRPGPACDPRW